MANLLTGVSQWGLKCVRRAGPAADGWTIVVIHLVEGKNMEKACCFNRVATEPVSLKASQCSTLY